MNLARLLARQLLDAERPGPRAFLRPMAKNWQKVLEDHGFHKANHFWHRHWPDRVWKTDFHVWADHTWRRDDEFPDDDEDWAKRIRDRDVNKPDFVRMGISRHAREWDIATPALAAALDELIPAMDQAAQEQTFDKALYFLAYDILARIGRKYGRPHNFSEAKEFIMKLHSDHREAAVVVRTGPPSPPQVVRVPAHWFRDRFLSGSRDAPGIALRVAPGAPPPPQGWSEEQWNYALEIIEYALNDKELSGVQDYEPPDDDDFERDGLLYTPAFSTPAFSWQYDLGKAAYDKHRKAARDAPRWRSVL